MSKNGFDRYADFLSRSPLVVVEWRDELSDAVGWLVIDSLRGSAAGGGTRMRQGGTRDEALFLAKTMAIKFQVAGPAIGGAKSLIAYRSDGKSTAERTGVLRRWYRSIGPYLCTCYGTGSDVGTKEEEVFEILNAELGLSNPQEGIVRGQGHLENNEMAQVFSQLADGIQMRVELPNFGRAMAGDLVTGYSVVRSLVHYYTHSEETIKEKRVLLQGFGNVGAAAAYYLAEAGARVVGITTSPRPGAYQFAYDPDGLDIATELTAPNRQHGALDEDRWPVSSEEPVKFWNTSADALIPAATSEQLTKERIECLADAGIRVISCGANVPFRELAPFKEGERARTDVQQYADENFAILPDFIANCGAARLFAFLMQNRPEVADAVANCKVQVLLDDVDTTVKNALGRVFKGGTTDTGLLERAYRLYVPNK